MNLLWVNKKIDEAIKEIKSIPQIDLTPINEKLNEIDSHNSLAKEEIIDTIKQTETEICSDIIRKTKEVKDDNITTRNLIRQKTKKIDENTQKLVDSEEEIKKMIEDEADEVESDIEKILNEEADMIESEMYNKEADQIESEINSNQSTDGND